MITTVQSYLRLCRQFIYRWRTDPRVTLTLRVTGCLVTGLLLSAASLLHRPLPLPLGLICSLSGWQAALVSAGSALGYWLFWGKAGLGGILWAALGLICSLVMVMLRPSRQHKLLMPTLAALVCALSGLMLQNLGDNTPPGIYLLRVGLAFGCTHLFALYLERRDSIADWLVGALAVLALAQVAPFPWLCLGQLLAAALTVQGTFPSAALAGLALDLAAITPVPMTAVCTLAWLLRLVPTGKRWVRGLMPALVYPLVMALGSTWDPLPIPALLLGGLAGLCAAAPTGHTHRRGEIGVAQVRLELVSAAFGQMQQLLLESAEAPIDEAALIQKACERACGSCSARKNCPGRVHAQGLSPQILNFPLLDSSLPFSCRRSGRLLQELRRSQEQLRLLRSGHRRQTEYQTALLQQYRFLTEYLQTLSDDLSRRVSTAATRYEPEVVFCGNRPRQDNGDRCLNFSGTGCRYYVILCDGMGTGMGALEEARTAGTLLRQLLQAGYPARYALGSLNSLFALRGKAGAATVDLAELQLDTGRTLVYKWGAAPSWILRREGSEKIGTAGPPPGVSVADDPEAALRLSLRRGEILALLSDGVGGEDALRCHVAADREPLGEIAARILECGSSAANDDATVALIRLRPLDLSA